ncbi:glutamine synthetase family protein [Modestobacter sp. VKM Ac-2978]|uniref:glutamine synthetase family protein n=1 Tax=Modestobacter sp. VKM Ac-2978 TaxID=3004132 RepID=UPI0022AB0686|nr:glutamine synthetase family protein [Modestobacter sp. VKM Ac-2978]MCZ2850300.1 glutamine synthetase family protein [Modestobacter sp. VKM Ac-2978]
MQQLAERLRHAGARTLTGVVSDSGGVIRAKTVPARRIESFARSGMGASLTWPVFCVDNGIAMTPEVNVVGDLRLTTDLERAVVLDHGFGWAPADVRDQQGELSPYCWRSVTRRQVARLASLGIEALVGSELEFGLLGADGRLLGESDGWPCYGAAVYSGLSDFAADLCERLDAAGVPVEQVHAEYGTGQFEISLPPRTPLAAADDVLLARAVIGRVARAHGLRDTFSPVPFAGGSGNGAHMHLSLTKDGVPLFSGGSLAEDLTTEGARAVAGIVRELPGSIAVLAGTVVSDERMQPGHWSGATACWGVENREAAVRLLRANNGNPHGANVEVKCVDSGANTYLATGLLLGFAASGIERELALPAPVEVDPRELTPQQAEAAAVVPLPSDAAGRIAMFEESQEVRAVLGPELHAAVLAVRRYEASLDAGPDLHARTRSAWSS